MLPIFFCFIVFCFWFRYELRKSSSKAERDKNTFFENESKANSTRKKSINSLNYITVSEKSILFIEINDDIIVKFQQRFRQLSDKKIVNLSNMTNTMLKLEYGPGNLTTLMSYDNNYTELVHSLFKYAERLYELSYITEAVEVLEYSINIGSDMINTYKLLAKIYVETEQKEKIKILTEHAEKLDSITKKPILENLNSAML